MNSPIGVLLDRDGTIIEERNYLADPAGVVLLPGAIEGLKRLQRLGCALVVVTNQSGVGRGLVTEDALNAVHERLKELLNSAGITLSGIYVCPHTPDDQCRCRKPAPGLVQQASRELGIEPAQSFVIGDKACDIELGRNVGARSILVRTGYGLQLERDLATRSDITQSDIIVDDLPAAAEWIEKNL